MKFLSPRQLCERLDERFRLLTRGSRDALPRHQTLRALIDWSYELLDERERALLHRLSVFAASFTIEGAVAAGSGGILAEEDAFDVLVSLVEKSLVLAESGQSERRYRLLETTRAYADEKLQAAGEREATFSRHLCYLRDLFGAAARSMSRTGRMAEIHRLLADESEDVQAALERAASPADIAIGRELLAALGPAWERKAGLRARLWTRIRGGRNRPA
jgi:predicted ATPase